MDLVVVGALGGVLRMGLFLWCDYRICTSTDSQNYPSLTTLCLVNREIFPLTQIQPGGRMYVDHNIIP